jgi:hypothetical protein
MLTKPTTKTKSEKADLSIADYIQDRINSASANGFNSVKMWVKTPNLTDATHLLNQGGFAYEILQTEPNSKQLLVTW